MFSRLLSLGGDGRNFPARRRARDRRVLILGLGFVGIILLGMAQFGEDGLATLLRLSSQEGELAAEVQKLEQANEELENRLHGLATDPSVLEKRAREEHNMQRPGEEVLTVLPAEPEAEAE